MTTKHMAFRATLISAVSMLPLLAASAARADDRVVADIDIPATGMATALENLIQQTDEAILFSPRMLDGLQATPLKGRYVPEQAARELLRDTSFEVMRDRAGVLIVRQKMAQATPQSAPVRLAAASEAIPVAALTSTEAEEVLITGSLIRGTEAVVPVTVMTNEDFEKAAVGNVSDLLRRATPAVSVVASSARSARPSNLSRANGVDIHFLGPLRTLVMVDGIRLPPSGYSVDQPDPSVVAPIALERVDVLADGASATYGSDAIAGVVNLILRRGYDGAISRAFYSFADGTDKWQVSQLWGKVWDTGSVTVSADYSREGALDGLSRDVNTLDFRPWGFDNRTSLANSMPATVSTNASPPPAPVASPVSASCANCYVAPPGVSGVGLNFNQFLKGTGVVETYRFSQFLGPNQRGSFSLTFDQEIIDGVELFADGYYSNRRSVFIADIAGPFGSGIMINVPITAAGYQFFPAGTTFSNGSPVQANIGVNFTPAAQGLSPRVSNGDISSRYTGGFNLDLPFDWRAKTYYAMSEYKSHFAATNLVNGNNMRAALGNIVNDPRGLQSSYTVRPAGTTPPAPGVINYAVPQYNVFCDARGFSCLDPATQAFVSAEWLDFTDYEIEQVGANLDGRLFDLPGGEVRAAVGGSYMSESVLYQHFNSASQFDAERPVTPPDERLSRDVYAAFAQVNVPIVGEGNAIPGIQELMLEASLRYDDYSDFGSTTNPKFGVNWTPIDGLTLKGTWGQSFRAPALVDLSAGMGKTLSTFNRAANGAADIFQICANNVLLAGSAAADLLAGYGIANCTQDTNANTVPDFRDVAYLAPRGINLPTGLQFPGWIINTGGVGGTLGLTRPNKPLDPEEAENWTIGFEYNPSFLPGLNLSATYFTTRIDGFIAQPGADFNDPTNRYIWTVRNAANNPGDSCGTSQQCFDAALQFYLNQPNIAAGITPGNVTLLADLAKRNLNRLEQDGIDFRGSFDYDAGGLGQWRLALAGTYMLHQEQTDLTPGTGLGTCGAPTCFTEDIYDSNSALPHINGRTIYPRIHARSELTWEDANSGLSASLFVNYQSHYFFWGIQGTQPAPIPPGFTAANWAPRNLIPEQYTFDLSVAYDLGDEPANDYLKGLSFRVTGTNIFDRMPPFVYGGSTPAYDASVFNPIGRVIAFEINKVW